MNLTYRLKVIGNWLTSKESIFNFFKGLPASEFSKNVLVLVIRAELKNTFIVFLPEEVAEKIQKVFFSKTLNQHFG